MKNLTVAVIGAPDYSRELGKKGTTSDITFYNLKKGDLTVTIIEPSRYPERIASLFYAVSLADRAILIVDEMNAAFGESVVMLDALKVTRGTIITRNYLTSDQLAPVLRGTVCEGYDWAEDEPGTLRDSLLQEADRVVQKGAGDKGIVPVDHFFPVKGIGTVILGCVERGSIRRHDSLAVLPLQKTVQIRSIQEHDDEVETAYQGDRVGLALKGIEPADMDRGCVLTANPEVMTSCTVRGSADLVRFWPTPLREGMVLSLGHWMQFVPCRVTLISGPDPRRPELTLSLDGDLIYVPGDHAVLHYLEGGKLRIVATMTLG